MGYSEGHTPAAADRQGGGEDALGVETAHDCSEPGSRVGCVILAKSLPLSESAQKLGRVPLEEGNPQGVCSGLYPILPLPVLQRPDPCPEAGELESGLQGQREARSLFPL